MMKGYIDGIPERLAQGVDEWLRAHGGWFFDQQRWGYEENDYEGSIEIDDSAPIPLEIRPILCRILACDDLEEYHSHAISIIAALWP